MIDSILQSCLDGIMKLTDEIANKVFDVLSNEGNHKKEYIDQYREEFVHKVTTDGMSRHWYPTENGGSVQVYFNEYSNLVYVWPETTNPVHEKNLRKNANRALKDLGFNVQDVHLT